MPEFDPIAHRTSLAVALWAAAAAGICALFADTRQAAAALAGGALAWTNWRLLAALVRWASRDPARRAARALLGFYAKGVVFVAAAAWLGIGWGLPSAGLLAGLSAFVGGALYGALRSVDTMRGPRAVEG